MLLWLIFTKYYSVIINYNSCSLSQSQKDDCPRICSIFCHVSKSQASNYLHYNAVNVLPKLSIMAVSEILGQNYTLRYLDSVFTISVQSKVQLQCHPNHHFRREIQVRLSGEDRDKNTAQNSPKHTNSSEKKSIFEPPFVLRIRARSTYATAAT